MKIVYCNIIKCICYLVVANDFSLIILILLPHEQDQSWIMFKRLRFNKIKTTKNNIFQYIRMTYSIW